MKATPYDYSIRIGRLTPVIQSRKRLLKGPPQAWLALGVFLAGIGICLGQPVITQQPQSRTNIAGTTATFLVEATGTPPLACQWQKWGGFPDFYDLTGCTNTALVLTNVGSADAVDYRVIVTNVDGAATSAVATLTVLLPPTNVKVTPANPSVSLGANLTLRATASGSMPFSYQWCLNSAPLGGQTNSFLNLTNIQLADAGAAYTVVVTNVAGAATSSVVRLTVDPTFTKITTGDVVSGGNSYGAAWADLDNDGYLDLVVLTPGLAPMIYHNNHDGTLTKMGSGSLPVLGAATGPIITALGDYNNDGWFDLLIGQYSGGFLALFKNNGDGTFTNLAKVSSMMQGRVPYPSGAGWVDYNNDGWLDLFVGDTTGNQSSALFYNNGDQTFSPAPSAGLTSPGFGVNGAAWADYDNDGYPDLFATAIPGGNLLYHNKGDGTFTRVTGSPATTEPLVVSIGCAWGDYDNDGYPDLFVANGDGNNQNYLYHNQGNGTFKKVTQGALATTAMSSQGCGWGDYDNDGFLDLFVSNWSSTGTNVLYHNNGDGTFTAVSLGSLTSDVGSFGCCGWADYDNDGFLDLFVANATGKNLLYRNNGNSNGWVKVQCVGRVSNRAAIGAKVRVKAFYRGASRWQMREMFGGDGVCSIQPLLAHFGLSDATNIATVRIEWPSGIAQELYNLAPRQSLTITEPTLTIPWRHRTVVLGTTVTLTTSGEETNALGFQWQFNGTNLPAQTNQTLVVASAGLADAGQYRLAIQTSGGLVLSPAANLVVLSQQPQLLALPLTNGLFALQVEGGISPGLIIQASTNLTDWVGVMTNKTTNAPLIFRDSATGQYRWRFYRTATP
jgi:hypothetical protein